MRIGILLLPLLLLSGCLGGSYRTIREFDISCRPLTGEKGFYLREFRNESTSGRKMQFRSAAGELFRDPYCLWALPPEALIPRAVNSAMPKVDRRTDVSGKLFRFEVDKKEMKLLLSGSFEINKCSRCFDIAVPVEKLTPEAIVRAAGKAADELAAAIMKVK